jgi:tetratricopeptide (TPR) repeat protein
LRTAALYLKNRLPLFNLISGYDDFGAEEKLPDDVSVDRTISLIDAFLETLPSEKLSLEAESAAAVDYVSAYLKDKNKIEPVAPAPALRGQDIIDEFLANGNERITLDLGGGVEETVTASPEACEESVAENSFFTETLANIYIKQGKYDKALEIIKRLCLEYPNKNRYFADQIRFLEKIIKYTKRK